MTLPSWSKVCCLSLISSCRARTCFRSSSFVFSTSLPFFSFSRFLPSSWALSSLRASSSSSSCASSGIGRALDSAGAVFPAREELGSLARGRGSEVRDRIALPPRLVLLALLDKPVPGAAEFPSSRRMGKCMRAQLSICEGSGSSSKSHSSLNGGSPASWATKHIVKLDTTASVAASAAYPKALRSKYFCHSVKPPSVRIWSTATVTASSAAPRERQ
mmetsp:Transcript_91722/g.262716  ORF Transcript_91722/g.262716 Transcript_91722/m.262716 type:complete len:217 (-) Transcript_91722:129-779(-)